MVLVVGPVERNPDGRGSQKVKYVWILRPAGSVAEDTREIRRVILVYGDMTRIIALILLMLFPLRGLIGQTDSPSSSISIRPADPPTAQTRDEMIRWRRIYGEEMEPVRREWSRVVRTIHQGRISELPQVCPAFQDRLAELDRGRLLAVADPVVKTWLGRGLVLLDGAAGQCRSERFFDLGFRLYKARHVIQAVDRRLERYQ